jgi:hypothetical protein
VAAAAAQLVVDVAALALPVVVVGVVAPEDRAAVAAGVLVAAVLVLAAAVLVLAERAVEVREVAAVAVAREAVPRAEQREVEHGEKG